MKVAIKECFYQASFVGEARQQETYEKAKKLEYPTPVEETPMPEEGEQRQKKILDRLQMIHHQVELWMATAFSM